MQVHQDNKIGRLHVKYNTTFMSSQLNELRGPILEEASALFVKGAEINLFNLVKSATAAGKKNILDLGKNNVTFVENLISSFHKEAVGNALSQEKEAQANQDGQ